MAGTISIDIDGLNTLVAFLKQIRDTLDNQQSLMPSLSDQLDAVLTGTASNIATFEAQFKTWTQLLNTVTTDMDQAYTALSLVLADARNAVNAL